MFVYAGLALNFLNQSVFKKLWTWGWNLLTHNFFTSVGAVFLLLISPKSDFLEPRLFEKLLEIKELGQFIYGCGTRVITAWAIGNDLFCLVSSFYHVYWGWPRFPYFFDGCHLLQVLCVWFTCVRWSCLSLWFERRLPAWLVLDVKTGLRLAFKEF